MEEQLKGGPQTALLGTGHWPALGFLLRALPYLPWPWRQTAWV